MQDWINARRAELKTQRDQAAGNANMCVGALQMLDAIEAELAKEAQPEMPPKPAADETPAQA